MYDTIIMGKGPAGITAAIYLHRSNKKVLVIGKDFGALETHSTIDNYYGVPSINGKELIERGVKQAVDMGITVLTDEITEVEYAESGFLVHTSNNVYETKTVFMANGKSRAKVKALGLKDYEGKGISYCVTCDGFFFREKKLAIVGNTEYMFSELAHMEAITKDITIFTNGLELEKDVDYTVVTEKIIEFKGDGDSLTTIITEDGKNYLVDGCFIAAGSAGGLDFALHLGLEVDSKKNIIVEDFMTNIPGIFAGGDIIGGIQQITKSSSDGLYASFAIKRFLKELNK